MGGNICKGFAGSASDGYVLTTLAGRSKILLQHLHSQGYVYPTGAAGVDVTANAAAWTLGAFAEIVPINTITKAFDIHAIYLESISANDTYELVLYAATTEASRIKIIRITNSGLLLTLPIQTAVLPPNTQIQAKLMNSAGSGVVKISVGYHQYD
jgi:hypothetical protein